MGLSLFLNSVLELYLSFGSEFLYNNLNPISILVLSLFFLFIFIMGIPSIPTFWKDEHTQKHRVRAKRRRKGGTWQGSRYYDSKDDDREVISFLKSTLGQNYDTTRCRQLLCPDPSCEVCNNAAAEINLLFSEAWGKSTPSVSSAASSASVTAQVTEPSSSQSSVFSAVPLGGLLPTPLPEPSPQPPSVLSYNPMTTLGNFQSPAPLGQTLPSSPITQNKVCEVTVHIPNNESECHTSTQTEHLACNVLLKEQESLWGLTSVVRRSKAHVTNSIDPVEFPLSSAFLEKFEHHLRKRLIQHHLGQPCRIQGSLSLMRPPSSCSGILESESTSGLSRISVEKDQSSENPTVGLSQPGSFYERSSEMFQIEENEGKEEGHSQENDPKVHLLRDSKTSSRKDVGGGFDMRLSRENSMVAGHSACQRRQENVQKVHFLRKKCEKTSEGQLPGTCKASLTPAQDVSSGDEEVAQLLPVHSEDSTVSTEKQQEPWLPRQALRSCQDQNFPPAVNHGIVCPPPEPTGPNSGELGAGDAQFRISGPGGQRFASQDAALENKLGSKSSHSLTQKGQATSLVDKEDIHFLRKLKNFFERLQPNILGNMQEALQEMGFPLSLTQRRGPVQSRAGFTGTAHVRSDMGKFPEEKLGRWPAVVTTCPQEPLPPAAQSGKPVQKGAVQAQAEPVQRRHFLRRAPSYDLTNAVSGRHTAILAGQGSTTAYTRNKDRPTLNAVASKQICQKHPQSVPLRGTLPHPYPSCRPQPANWPPAVLTTAGGAACRDQPPRFRHTMLLQNFQGQTFPTPN